MGARVGCGRSYKEGQEGNNTGPWVATSDGVVVKLPAKLGPVQIVDWLKLHFPEALLIRVVEDDGTEYKWRFTGISNLTMLGFYDSVTKIVYGRSRSESIANGICVDCGKLPMFKTESQYKEFLISGLCETCQLKVFGKE